MNSTDPIPILPRYADWLTVQQVAQHVGASAVVVTNWIKQGVKSERGKIHLAAVKVGGHWKIDPAAVATFINATTTAALPESATTAATTSASETEASRKRRVEACMARLKARGVGVDASQPRKRK